MDTDKKPLFQQERFFHPDPAEVTGIPRQSGNDPMVPPFTMSTPSPRHRPARECEPQCSTTTLYPRKARAQPRYTASSHRQTNRRISAAVPPLCQLPLNPVLKDGNTLKVPLRWNAPEPQKHRTTLPTVSAEPLERHLLAEHEPQEQRRYRNAIPRTYLQRPRTSTLSLNDDTPALCHLNGNAPTALPDPGPSQGRTAARQTHTRQHRAPPRTTPSANPERTQRTPRQTLPCQNPPEP